MFKVVHAPCVNVNDLEMTLVQWHVDPWQEIKKNDLICEVETTKSIEEIHSEYAGYIYPVVKNSDTVKVGDPLAYIFDSNDPKQLDSIDATKGQEDVTISKKARSLMDEFGLSVSDFPKFSSISSEAVIARIRELKVKEFPYDKNKTKDTLSKIQINKKSIVLYGEKNQALLAFDALQSQEDYDVIAYISNMSDLVEFYGIPVVHSKALKELQALGLENVCICATEFEELRRKEKECNSLGYNIISAIHATACVAPTANLGKGVFVGAQAVIGPDVEVGDYSRVLCAATIAHHSKLGKYTVVADGSNLGGNVIVEDYCFIGMGVTINKRVVLGRKSTVVSGATVIDHVAERQIYRHANK